MYKTTYLMITAMLLTICGSAGIVLGQEMAIPVPDDCGTVVCDQCQQPCLPCQKPCKPLGAICRLFSGVCNACSIECKEVEVEKKLFKGKCEVICLPILKPNCGAAQMPQTVCCGTPDCSCPRCCPSPLCVTCGPPLIQKKLYMKKCTETKIVYKCNTNCCQTAPCEPACGCGTVIESGQPVLIEEEPEKAKDVKDPKTAMILPIDIPSRSVVYPSPLN